MRATLLLCFVLIVNLFNANLCSAEESWWQLLGPTGDGHADKADLPVRWTDRENVAWKTAIHDRGWSSPVIHGDQLWLTTATTDGCSSPTIFALCVGARLEQNSGDKLRQIVRKIRCANLIFDILIGEKGREYGGGANRYRTNEFGCQAARFNVTMGR